MIAAEQFHQRRKDAKSLQRQLIPGVENVIFVLFINGLAWLPFWLGSNRPIAWAINAMIFPGLAILYELYLILRRLPHPVAIRCIRTSAVLFALAGSWAIIQNATWTPTTWQHPIWQLASEILGRPVLGSISVDRDLTAVALLRLMTSASVFWLALQLASDPRRARFLLWSVVVIGAIYAVVGLFAVAFMPDGVMFEEIVPTHMVSSTFVNKNHFGTYAGIGLVAAVASIHRLYRRELQQSGDLLRHKIAALISATGGKGALPLALAFLILAALLLSGSRGAIISTALGLLALFAVRGARRFGRNEVVLAVFAVVIIGAVFVGFGDKFVGRFGEQGIYDEDRLAVYKITMRSILSAPFLGYGYGTFMATFPMFHDSTVGVWAFLTQAHNTYLEVFQGLGLLFGVMLIGSVIALVFACAKGATTLQRNATVPAIAVGVSVLVGIHALIDFSLQVQAITLTYMAVLGAGVAQAKSGESSLQDGKWPR